MMSTDWGVRERGSGRNIRTEKGRSNRIWETTAE
jgi:hypothetical protein